MLFTLSRLFGVKTGALAALESRMSDDFEADAGIDAAIKVGVEGVHQLSPLTRLSVQRLLAC